MHFLICISFCAIVKDLDYENVVWIQCHLSQTYNWNYSGGGHGYTHPTPEEEQDVSM